MRLQNDIIKSASFSKPIMFYKTKHNKLIKQGTHSLDKFYTSRKYKIYRIFYFQFSITVNLRVETKLLKLIELYKSVLQ